MKGFTGAKYKKFTNASEAEAFAGVPLTASAKEAAAANSAKVAAAEAANNKKRGMSPDIEDESGWDVVYCDGACKGNGTPGSVAGVGVWWGWNDPRCVITVQLYIVSPFVHHKRVQESCRAMSRRSNK